MDAEMEQQINAASSLISFMSQPPENGQATSDDQWAHHDGKSRV